MRQLGLCAIFLALVSGAARADAQVCTPGKQETCACPGGAVGAQRCNDAGSGYEVCTCASAAPDPEPTPSGRGKGMIIAGASLLGAGYFLSIATSAVALGIGAAQSADNGPACTDSVGFGFVPLVGTFLAAANYPNYQKLDARGQTASCADHTEAVVAVATVLGLIQVGGAGLLTTGLVLRGTSPDETALRISVGPGTIALGLTWGAP